MPENRYIQAIGQRATWLLISVVGVFLLLIATAATASAQSKPPDSAKIDKQVRVKGQPSFSDSVKASPGQMVEYKVTVTNTTKEGDLLAEVQDVIGDGVDFIEDTLNIDGTPSADNTSLFSTKGIAVGSLKPGQTKTVKYEATIPANANTCGKSGLKNEAYVRVNGQELADDTAFVEVCPAGMPKAGPGDTALLLFLSSSVIAAAAHYTYTRKRSV